MSKKKSVALRGKDLLGAGYDGKKESIYNRRGSCLGTSNLNCSY
jgi:hypothetical protein